MSDNIKVIHNRTYVLTDGKWMTVHGYEIDPHDPDYLTINPLEKKLNNENR